MLDAQWIFSGLTVMVDLDIFLFYQCVRVSSWSEAYSADKFKWFTVWSSHRSVFKSAKIVQKHDNVAIFTVHDILLKVDEFDESLQ